MVSLLKHCDYEKVQSGSFKSHVNGSKLDRVYHNVESLVAVPIVDKFNIVLTHLSVVTKVTKTQATYSYKLENTLSQGILDILKGLPLESNNGGERVVPQEKKSLDTLGFLPAWTFVSTGNKSWLSDMESYYTYENGVVELPCAGFNYKKILKQKFSNVVRPRVPKRARVTKFCCQVDTEDVDEILSELERLKSLSELPFAKEHFENKHSQDLLDRPVVAGLGHSYRLHKAQGRLLNEIKMIKSVASLCKLQIGVPLFKKGTYGFLAMSGGQVDHLVWSDRSVELREALLDLQPQGTVVSSVGEFADIAKAKVSEKFSALYIDSFVEKLVNALRNQVSNKCWSFLVNIKNSIAGWFKILFKGELINKVLVSVENAEVWHRTLFFVSLLLLGSIGILTLSVVRSWLSPKREVVLVGQGSDPMPLFATLFSAFALNPAQQAAVEKKARWMNTVCVSARSVSNILITAFNWLPAVFKNAVYAKFGAQEVVLKDRAEDFRLKAEFLIKQSKQPLVVTSPVFMQTLDNSLEEVGDLLMEDFPRTCSSIKIMLHTHYQRLLAVKTDLELFKASGYKRPEPLCIHMFGEPGVGKTLKAEDLLLKSCGIMQHDIFYRSLSEEFWSGYCGQRAVILDEFLVGPKETRVSRATEFLSMISSSKMSLNMPTLDSPTTGIKGAWLRARVVCTMNNTAYDKVDGVSATALQRRRHVNVRVDVRKEFSDEYQLKGYVDTSRFSQEDLEEAKWLEFYLCPPVDPHGDSKKARAFRNDLEPCYRKPMSFKTLCQYVRSVWEEKLARNRDLIEKEEELENVVQKELSRIVLRTPKIHSIKDAAQIVLGMKSPEDCSETPEEDDPAPTDSFDVNADRTTDEVYLARESRVQLVGQDPYPDWMTNPGSFYPVGWEPQAKPDPVVTESPGIGFNVAPAPYSRAHWTTRSVNTKVDARFLDERREKFWKVNHTILDELRHMRSVEKIEDRPICDTWLEYTEPENRAWRITDRERESMAQAKRIGKFMCSGSGDYNWVPTRVTRRLLQSCEYYTILNVASFKEPIQNWVRGSLLYYPLNTAIINTWGLIRPPDMSCYIFGPALAKKMVRNFNYSTSVKAKRPSVRRIEQKNLQNEALDTVCVFLDKLDNVMSACCNDRATPFKLSEEEIQDRIDRGVDVPAETLTEYARFWVQSSVESSSSSCLGNAWKFFKGCSEFVPWYNVCIGVACLTSFIMFCRSMLGNNPILYSQAYAHEEDPDEEYMDTRQTTRSSRGNKNRNNNRGGFGMRKHKGQSYGQGMVPIQQLQLDVDGCVVNCTRIKQRWVMTYAHSLHHHFSESNIKDGDSYTVNWNGAVLKAEFRESDFIFDMDEDGFLYSDLLFINVRCPQLNMQRDVTHMFPYASELPRRGSRITIKTPSNRFFSDMQVKSESYVAHGNRFEMANCLFYRLPTQKGDCGSLIKAASGVMAGRPLGIHVAGSGLEDLPVGIGIFVDRETIEDFIGEDSVQLEGQGPVLDFVEQVLSEDFPNILEIRPASEEERVYLNRKTKLVESKIGGLLPWSSDKTPAILSRQDPRADGKDPLDVAVKELVSAEKIVLDNQNLKLCVSEISANLIECLDFNLTGGLRHLTLEEAVFGIPGVLTGVKLKTHAGAPYCHYTVKQGKKDLFDPTVEPKWISPEFRTNCLNLYKQVLRGEIVHKNFLGFMKDETRSCSKIAGVKTRLTYSNDVMFNVVCRMIFGSLVVSLNKSFPSHGYCLGVNPASFDMEKIYQRVSREPDRIVAGDFSGFDLRHQRQVMDSCFEIIWRISKGCLGEKKVFDLLRDCETKCPLIIGCFYLRTVCNNPSGGFWTTILNCLTAEIYFRYAFRIRYPQHIFDKHIGFVVLGDDHLLSISKRVEWNPLMIRDDLAAIGQKYTSAWKDEELTEDYISFERSLFLGCQPVFVSGCWSGALRKSSIEEMVCWTRNKNRTIHQICDMAACFASQWDEDYYYYICNSINDALEQVAEPKIAVYPYDSLRFAVANRTSEKSDKFIFWAQSPMTPLPYQYQKEGRVVELVGQSGDLLEDKDISGASVSSDSIASHNQADDATISTGLEGFVLRKTFKWETKKNKNEVIYSVSVPFGLLGEGGQNHTQNSPFYQYLYSRPDIEVAFELTGTPLFRGLLIVSVCPLVNASYVAGNATMLNHIFLEPSGNSRGSITVPFSWWYTHLNNFQAETIDQRVATVNVHVLSALHTGASNTDYVNISVLSKFHSSFQVPRPMRVHREQPVYGLVAQGISSSKVSYNISDVAGSVPIENFSKPSSSVQAAPLDNTPLVGGGVPTFNQFPSMSRVNGLQSTQRMSFHPQELDREPLSLKSSLDSDISYLLEQPCLWTSMAWKEDQSSGAVGNFCLNSVLTPGVVDQNYGLLISSNMVILNMFRFFRATFCLRVKAVKTIFHSGSLMVSVYYGTHLANSDYRDCVFSKVLNFDEVNDDHVVRIPFNASQEFLRCYEGIADDSNVTMGTVEFTVLNELKCNNSIALGEVDLLTFGWLEDVQVAVGNPFPAVDFDSNCAVNFVAEAQAGEIGSSINEEPAMTPNKLLVGRKFEYRVANLLDLVKRYSFLRIPKPQTIFVRTKSFDVYKFVVTPSFMLSDMFAGWSGSLRFRFVSDSSFPGFVWFFPDAQAETHAGFCLLGDEAYAQIGQEQCWGPLNKGALIQEMMSPYGSGSFIDVTVPFTSEANFLPVNREDTSAPLDCGVGALYVRVPTGSFLEGFVAAGDDFRFHHFIPGYHRIQPVGRGFTKQARVVNYFVKPQSTPTMLIDPVVSEVEEVKEEDSPPSSQKTGSKTKASPGDKTGLGR